MAIHFPRVWSFKFYKRTPLPKNFWIVLVPFFLKETFFCQNLQVQFPFVRNFLSAIFVTCSQKFPMQFPTNWQFSILSAFKILVYALTIAHSPTFVLMHSQIKPLPGNSYDWQVSIWQFFCNPVEAGLSFKGSIKEQLRIIPSLNNLQNYK